MAKLSVVVITRNEEDTLPRCLSSVAWADEVIVVDSGSQDDTRQIAWEHGATVFEIEWSGFGAAKAYGVDKATGEWILSLDADEAVSEELAQEIQLILRGETDFHGFDMPRKTRFLGRWIKHCGWYPDRVLRLFLKSRGKFDNARVHEKVILDGRMGHLSGELLHYSYPSLEHYLDKSNRYTTLGAEEAYRKGRRTTWFDLVIRPLVSFIAHYVSRQGFRDGREGFLVSVLSSLAVLVKYAKLKDMERQRESSEGDCK